MAKQLHPFQRAKSGFNVTKMGKISSKATNWSNFRRKFRAKRNKNFQNSSDIVSKQSENTSMSLEWLRSKSPLRAKTLRHRTSFICVWTIYSTFGSGNVFCITLSMAMRNGFNVITQNEKSQGSSHTITSQTKPDIQSLKVMCIWLAFSCWNRKRDTVTEKFRIPEASWQNHIAKWQH